MIFYVVLATLLGNTVPSTQLKTILGYKAFSMFESVGRMFRGYKNSDNRTSSPKRTRIKEDGPSGNYDNVYEVKIDNSTKILKRISQLHSEQLMTDVILIINGREHPAHRLLLCASSDVFQVMLMKPEWTEWHESRIILQEQQQCADVFHLFLAYFYSGRIVLTHDNVMSILTLADKYNVKDLVKTCVSFMSDNVSHAAAHNQLIAWFQYTLACGHNDVSKNCQNFIKWNLGSIAQTEDFGNFDSDVFMSLLQQNDLIVENEISLYQYAVKWLDHQNEHLKQDNTSETKIEQHMRKLTEQIMMHIRFPMMTPRQLAELLLSPLINKYKEFFVERMAIGMIYHSGQEDRVSHICKEDSGKLLFTPRLYTNDNFSSLLCVDNFSSVPFYGTCTFMFSSHRHLADHKGDSTCDWVVELYPKGVWFKKFLLIVWQGTMELPEYVMLTVRLTVTCKDVTENRVKIGVLIYGEKAGIEHVIQVTERIHTFDDEKRVVNIDDLIAFAELNPPPTNNSKECPNSSYLLGSNRNSLKMHIIITPLTEFCSTYSSDLNVK